MGKQFDYTAVKKYLEIKARKYNDAGMGVLLNLTGGKQNLNCGRIFDDQLKCTVF